MRLPWRYSLRSLLQRRTRSLLAAAGVGAAVFTSVSMLALWRGVAQSTRRTGIEDCVLVLSRGAEAMEFSAVEPATFHRIAAAEGVARRDGEPLASPELYLSTHVGIEGTGTDDLRGVVRGVVPVAFAVHGRVRVVEGGPPEPGFRVAVGRLAAAKLGVRSSLLQPGAVLSFEGRRWEVAGVFEAEGTLAESEIWAHLEDLRAASRREDYSAVLLATEGPRATEDVLFDLASRTDVRVDARPHAEYYAAAAAALRPVGVVCGVMALLLGLGGLMAGANTMSASVLGRTREMGVLLVLGWRRRALVASFLLESILLCLAGGLAGTLAAWALHGLPMRIPMGAFQFVVDGATMAAGLGLALAIGVLGVLPPLLRAARLPAAEALRAGRDGTG